MTSFYVIILTQPFVLVSPPTLRVVGSSTYAITFGQLMASLFLTSGTLWDLHWCPGTALHTAFRHTTGKKSRAFSFPHRRVLHCPRVDSVAVWLCTGGMRDTLVTHTHVPGKLPPRNPHTSPTPVPRSQPQMCGIHPARCHDAPEDGNALLPITYINVIIH